MSWQYGLASPPLGPSLDMGDCSYFYRMETSSRKQPKKISFLSVTDMASEVAAKLLDTVKVKADEGEEEEDEEDLVDPASAIKEKCGEDQCNTAKVDLESSKGTKLSPRRDWMIALPG